MTTTQQDAADRLANEFSRLVRQELADQLDEIRARNKTYSPNVCATHDFSDANMIMAEAFQTVVGREIDLDSDADTALWNDAWGIAKAAEFNDTRD